MFNQESIPRDDRDNPSKNVARDDRSLLRRVAKGDQDAFSELYAAHSISLYSYLLRLIHDSAVAEDLLQETYIAVWKGAKRFRGRASVKTWMFRIAHNQAVSWLRKYAGKEHLDEEHFPAVDEETEDNLILEWQTERLLHAVDKLSANHRAVIELVFVQELSYREVALVMDCPVGTVKSRMSYALKHLNQLIQNSKLDHE